MSVYSQLIKPLITGDETLRSSYKDVLREAFGDDVTQVDFQNSSLRAGVSASYCQFQLYFAVSRITGGQGSLTLTIGDKAGFIAENPGIRYVNDVNSYLYFSNSGESRSLNVALVIGDSEGLEAFTKLVNHIVGLIRPNPVPGCVKVWDDTCRVSWTNRRPTNSSIIKVGDEYFWHPTQRSDYYFRKLYSSSTDFEWVFSRDVPEDCVAYNGDFYRPGTLTPVYRSFDSEGQRGVLVVANMPEHVVIEQGYRFYDTPNGRVYTEEPVPYRDYNAKAVWNYTARIEKLLEATDLFRFGKMDLYRHRDKDEVPFLGWELEACCNRSTEGYEPTAVGMRKALDKMVMCKQDGSISPTGFETVSVPATLDFWKEAPIAEGLDKLRSAPFNMRSYEHSSCGFHVHVSRAALSVLDLQKIERFMHNPANRDFLCAVAGRGANSYANYNDNLFNDRKSRRRRRTTYRPSYLSAHYTTEALAFRARAETVPVRKLVRNLYGLIDFGVLQGQASDDIYTVHYRDEGWNEPRVEQSIINGVLELAAERDDSCRTCMLALLKFCYPDREFALPDPNGNKDHAWKAGIRKTSLSFKRKDSYEAASRVDGPVGKGEARYDVLNTKNKNTVEFRLFKGTMNADSIYRYLEFVDALVRFVPSTSASNEGLDFRKFIDFVKDDSFNRARYSTLLAFFVSKQYISRKDIRKREIKELTEADNVFNDTRVSPRPNPAVVESEPGFLDDEEDYAADDCECPGCRPDLHEDNYEDEDR